MDFVIAGAQKSGTSALFMYLKKHPDIQVSDTKELHFFDNDDYFNENKPNYGLLHQHFNKKKAYKLCGESTPIYMYWKPCMQRIWEYNPDIKIIVILRNPVERAFSQWNMATTNKKITEDFYPCIVKEYELLQQTSHTQSRLYSYIDRGLYWEQVERMYSFFRKENILILKYEMFKNNQCAELNKVFSFLGVDEKNYTFKSLQSHQIEYVRKMTREEKEFLLKVFSDETDKIENMLGWNCDDWRN